MILLEYAVSLAHLMSSAAWFGALVYRAFFVDPKSLQFFGGGSEYERFSLHLAHGMRRVVMASLLVCGLSGFVLMGLRWNQSSIWQLLMASKVLGWSVAFGLFTYISWVYWPRRVFTTRDEYARERRLGVILSLVMIGIAAAGLAIGQLCQYLAMFESM